MKQKVLFTFFLFFLIIQSFRGNSETIADYNYLKLVLSKTDAKPRVEILIRLSKMVCDTAPSSSFLFAYEALKVSTQIDYSKGKADARMLIGDYFTRQKKYLPALEFYLGSKQLYAKSNDQEGILTVYHAMGSLLDFLRDYNTANIYFQKGLSLAKALHKLTWVGLFLQELGVIEQQTGNFDKALVQYKKALLALQQAGDRPAMLNVYNSIGSVYLDEGRYDDAIQFYMKFINLNEPSVRPHLGTMYTRIAHAWENRKKYRKALSNNFNALAIRRQMGQMVDYNSSLINIAGNYFLLNKVDSAWMFMNEGLKMAEANKRTYLIENVYRMLYNYYSSRNDYKNALYYFQLYGETGDSIIIDKNKGDLAILEGNQRIQSIEEGNAILIKENIIQSLNLRNQHFQVLFLQIILGLAAIMILFSFYHYVRTVRSKREIGRIFEQMLKEVHDLEATNKRIAEQEKQYRFFAEKAVDFITRFDKNMKCIYASPASFRVFGYGQEEILDKSIYDLTHPDFYDYVSQRFDKMLLEKTSKQFNYMAKKKNGKTFWVESMLNPVFNKNTGELEEVVGITRDIQERKIKELEIMEGTKQKENLLKEIHHRVKNNFAILVSLINMQKDQTSTPELLQSLTDLQLRIRTMALVHEMLYRSSDLENISFADYIQSLSSVIIGTFNRRDIQLNFEVQNGTMDIETAIPLGLIINEILSNAYKHAFPDNHPGTIWICLKEQPDSTGMSLTIRDDGVGFPKDFKLEKCKTMGLQVVQILIKQIEGEMIFIDRPHAVFTIFFSRPK